MIVRPWLFFRIKDEVESLWRRFQKNVSDIVEDAGGLSGARVAQPPQITAAATPISRKYTRIFLESGFRVA